MTNRLILGIPTPAPHCLSPFRAYQLPQPPLCQPLPQLCQLFQSCQLLQGATGGPINTPKPPLPHPPLNHATRLSPPTSTLASIPGPVISNTAPRIASSRSETRGTGVVGGSALVGCSRATLGALEANRIDIPMAPDGASADKILRYLRCRDNAPSLVDCLRALGQTDEQAPQTKILS